MIKPEAESSAEKILRETGTYRVPVPINVVAERLSLRVEAAELGEKISGVLVVEGGRGAIGYNSSHAVVRQRFTVAHEIAHFVLHLGKTEQSRRSQLFVDRYVAFRTENSSTGNDFKEVEANQFGAALLMPRNLVHDEISRNELDLDDEDALFLLANRFQVSALAMSHRLSSLGLIRFNSLTKTTRDRV